MTVKIDLYRKHEKSRAKVAFGIISEVLGLISLYYVIKGNGERIIIPFWLMYLGFLFIAEGLGRDIFSIFGEPYVLVDDEKIETKFTSIEKPSRVSWENVSSVKFGVTKIEIKRKDGKTFVIPYGQLSYENVQKIKDAIRVLAKEKLQPRENEEARTEPEALAS